jgi:hypothetical protein
MVDRSVGGKQAHHTTTCITSGKCFMILALASVHQKNSQIFEIFGSRFVNLSKRLPREPNAKSHHAGDALTFDPLDVCSNDISSTAGLQEKMVFC